MINNHNIYSLLSGERIKNRLITKLIIVLLMSFIIIYFLSNTIFFYIVLFLGIYSIYILKKIYDIYELKIRSNQIKNTIGNDIEYFRNIVNIDVYLLELASHEIRSDKAFMMELTKENPEAIMFASDKLKKDPEILKMINMFE